MSRNPVLEDLENEDEIEVVNLIDLSAIIKDQTENRYVLGKTINIEYKQGMILKKLKSKSRLLFPPHSGRK